jgi:hypothetical protein
MTTSWKARRHLVIYWTYEMKNAAGHRKTSLFDILVGARSSNGEPIEKNSNKHKTDQGW